MRKLIAALVLIFGLSLSTPATAGQAKLPVICGPVGDVMEHLITNNFSLQEQGVTVAGQLMQVWLSHETGEWMMVLVLPSDGACLVAQGTDWGPYAPAKFQAGTLH